MGWLASRHPHWSARRVRRAAWLGGSWCRLRLAGRDVCTSARPTGRVRVQPLAPCRDVCTSARRTGRDLVQAFATPRFGYLGPCLVADRASPYSPLQLSGCRTGAPRRRPPARRRSDWGITSGALQPPVCPGGPGRGRDRFWGTFRALGDEGDSFVSLLSPRRANVPQSGLVHRERSCQGPGIET
jgi:hypothetical protein